MPADDLVLNVRQIANYTDGGYAHSDDQILLQRGGLGGPYFSLEAGDFVSTALAGNFTLPLSVGVGAPGGAAGGQIFTDGVSTVADGFWMWNAFSTGTVDQFLTSGWAARVDFDPILGWEFWSASGAAQASVPWVLQANISVDGHMALAQQLSLGRDPIAPLEAATAQYVAAAVAATVLSFNGRRGDVGLWIDDIICAGGAPIYSPRFQGSPRACTPPPTSNSTRLATTAFVQGMIAALTLDYAPLDSPAFIGVPTAPTPPLGSSDGTLATTAFVQTAVAGSVAGVSSFNTRTGIVTLTGADITSAGGAILNSPAFTGTPTAPTAPPGTSTSQIATTSFVLTESGFAPLASPVFTGIPTAPTPTPGTNTTQLATTAYVQAAIVGINVGVTTFNGRSGAVSLLANDITAAGGAILASPAFTGTPSAPTPPPGDSSTRLATTAYVQSLAGFAPLASPAFTGVPTAPTAAPGANSTQLATTAYVEAAIANSTAGVASFNGRTGAVTLQANDISGAGGALLASPVLTGTPTAPTAAASTSTTQLATCAFVTAAIAAIAIPAASSTTPLMDGTAAIGNATTWARANHVHPSDTSRLPLTGGTLTGGLLGTTASFTGSLSSATFVAVNAAVVSQGSSGTPSPSFYLWNAASAVMGSLSWMNTNGAVELANNFQGGGTASITVTPSFNVNCTPYSPAGGAWSASSDARIKTVYGDYQVGLDEVLALRPVHFSYKGNDTDVAEQAKGAAPYEASLHAVVARQAKRFVGMIAQEVEAVFPGMVIPRTGFIDGVEVSDFRDMDTTPLIYALVNAVKTLAARLDALERTPA